ncbi:uncharacterized protein LOC103517939 [Diaphorina citri]|uniref:Uncharacterized protein LOC103517939 n=1 Tax=Diaphorina citri TaxID=121845 RepID=A0A3Q0JB46_DIACI|nr:uncharacterized protein LOC103517939 [Diaphorina citri]
MNVRSTTFPHKSAHKETWNSRDGRTSNQIDHILISNRHRSTISDIRAFRGAEIGSDHNLVIATVKAKLRTTQKLKRGYIKKPDLEKLQSPSEVIRYCVEVENRFQALERNDEEDCNVTWNNIKEVILAAGEKCLPSRTKAKKKWFDNECQDLVNQTIHKRREWLQAGKNETTTKAYKDEVVNMLWLLSHGYTEEAMIPRNICRMLLEEITPFKCQL